MTKQGEGMVEASGVRWDDEPLRGVLSINGVPMGETFRSAVGRWQWRCYRCEITAESFLATPIGELRSKLVEHVMGCGSELHPVVVAGDFRYKVGDVVMLNSGGPAMTVEFVVHHHDEGAVRISDIDTHVYTVAWLRDDGDHQGAEFDERMLREYVSGCEA